MSCLRLFSIPRFNSLLNSESDNDVNIRYGDIVVTAGKYSILESAALFSLADVVVSSDTGPLHIATAVKKPFCIGLYGAASVGRTGPWGVNHFAVSADLDCIPCDRRKCKIKEYRVKEINPCLMAIKPEHILRVIKDNDLLV